MNEHEQFIDEFVSESDRAAVVLGAAKLDDLLMRALIAFMLPSTRGEDELFAQGKPLRSFGLKIDLAYRLGVITEQFRNALHLIRKLRNTFAHNLEGCTLDNPENHGRVLELVKPYQGRLFFESVMTSHFGDERNDSVYFRTVLAIHMYRLSTLSKNVERIPADHPWNILVSNWEAFENVEGEDA